MEFENLRERLCLAAHLNFESWKTKADVGIKQIAESMYAYARSYQAGDCYLQLDSETQAEYVRDQFAKNGLVTDLFTNHDGTLGIYLRWSERPGGPENMTGKVAFRVSEWWGVEPIEKGLAQAAVAKWRESREARLRLVKTAGLWGPV
ncbi:hypothetical protein [Cupriavidus pinatubonensis]|uniref:Uncharacterized protein n=1 Tax=Cupriavidus pinatubonensis TaxID=248026 RepID=A0ABN7XU27_9BURK|nr:hypothetical protein [Cupriavidus pinatubonensis]CAG9163874.1 hypothetical protein LMG23994_00317 [Cupriavidus pinatubonensis]